MILPWLLDRLLPAKPKDDPLPCLGEIVDQPLEKQAAAIMTALGQGSLSPLEAKNLLEILKIKANIAEISEMEQKLKELLQENQSNADSSQNGVVRIYIPDNGRGG